VWGYFISTVVLIHATLAINSFAHRFGSRRYQTRDQSRNSFLLALLTLGEGWHNNHHHYAGAARQGFFWWEIDISYYCLKLMEKMGLVWDLKPVPEHKKWAFVNQQSREINNSDTVNAAVSWPPLEISKVSLDEGCKEYCKDADRASSLEQKSKWRRNK